MSVFQFFRIRFVVFCFIILGLVLLLGFRTIFCKIDIGCGPTVFRLIDGGSFSIRIFSLYCCSFEEYNSVLLVCFLPFLPFSVNFQLIYPLVRFMSKA